MIYEDTFPGNFREFLIELVSGNLEKSHILVVYAQ